VGNFNGSFWLSNPAEPLTGYARVIGASDIAQSLRTRLGHTIAAQLQTGAEGVTPDALQRAALDSRAMSAILFKQPVLDRLCAPASATAVSEDDIKQSCTILAAWNDTGAADARGATLWNAFWTRLEDIPAAQLYAVPFDPQHPLTTPSGIAVGRDKLVSVMRAALAALKRAGIAADAPRSAALYIQRNGERIPLYGGCSEVGYFTAACAQHPFDQHADSMDVNPDGNSYLQIVRFDHDDVVADTLLASSESDDPASAHYADATRAYADKQWQRVPFTDAAIARDPAHVSEILEAPASTSGASH
jgi:acyl-homoserine-lactone acylase